MIERYRTKVMENLWSQKNRYESFLKVELACSFAWNKLGLISDVEYQKLSKASFNIADIYKIEQKVKHDVIAFTQAVSGSLGDEKKWFHYGLTSTDVVDTAQSLILRDVNKVINQGIAAFMKVVKQKAQLYKNTPTIGRTHGIHAEITSFGLKFALWYEDLKRLKLLFENASSNIEIAKISGAVGNYSANLPQLQEIAAKKLGLKEANISTQVLQRDRHAHYLSVIALIGTQLEKIAVEIRHLSRTEVKEVAEYFSSKQKGSSAMPHKRNPISSENICGLARVLKGYMMSSYENIALWHERDISHSSVERIILVDATTLLDYMLKRFVKTINSLVVNEEKMLKNIELTNGAIYAQKILHMLIDKGFEREKAYDLVKMITEEALKESVSFQELISKEKEVRSYLLVNEIKTAFSIQYYLRFVDDIYKKVFS